jgi:hypothetical protein
MSNQNLEQRIGIKFCVKLGKSANSMFVVLCEAYSKGAMKKLIVFLWLKQLRKD